MKRIKQALNKVAAMKRSKLSPADWLQVEANMAFLREFVYGPAKIFNV